MPVIDYAVPCMLSSIDQRTNSVSLFSVVETIEIVERPDAQVDDISSSFAMELITLWRREGDESSDENFQQVVCLRTPDGVETELCRTDFTVPHRRSRTHVRLPPIEFAQSGEYALLIGLGADDQRIAFEYRIFLEIARLDVIIKLNHEELELLNKPVVGQGGFQSFLRRLQRQVAGDQLVLTVPDSKRVIDYVQRYGQGGFQARLKRIVSEIQRQLSDKAAA